MPPSGEPPHGQAETAPLHWLRPLILGLTVLAAALAAAGWALARASGSGDPTASAPLPRPPAATWERLPPGTAAPPLELPGLEGGTVSLDRLRGRPVVVNFWASWCEPCKREFPLLQAAAERHRGAGLVVVGVVTGDDPEAARAFARKQQARWPMALDRERRATARWGVLGLPETFFLRPDGTLASHHRGELRPEALDAQLAPILKP